MSDIREEFNEFLLELKEESSFSDYLGSWHKAKIEDWIVNKLAEHEAELWQKIEEMKGLQSLRTRDQALSDVQLLLNNKK